MNEYFIEGCPIRWHDLVEIAEFLQHLPPRLLYLFSCSRVFLGPVPLFWILVLEINGSTVLTYREFPRW